MREARKWKILVESGADCPSHYRLAFISHAYDKRNSSLSDIIINLIDVEAQSLRVDPFKSRKAFSKFTFFHELNMLEASHGSRFH
jgi:hypothetical protein